MTAALKLAPALPLEEAAEYFIRAELSRMGLRWIGRVSWNEAHWLLMQKAVERHEGRLSATGALVVDTGIHTGRSPKDKYIVGDAGTEANVWWDNNQRMERVQFDLLKSDMLAHARMKDLFVQDLEACPGTDPLAVRLITETAWASLFMRHLLKPSEVAAGSFVPQFHIINLPSFKANALRHGTRSETVIALDFTQRMVLIAGTAYAGEMKKAVFTLLNYLLPEQGVLPMHCSSNVGEEGDTAIFFGLSGTGKTTLSADPARALIGDDEHGWSDAGVFNIENGCYAKAINLDAAQEPAIHDAALAFGSVLENVVMDDKSGVINFGDGCKTENTRAAYPLNKIGNAKPGLVAKAPKVLVMLTADAFGVLPPVVKLSTDEAIEMFLLGYTSKLAGTERGVKEPEATFSACFGAPFLPRKPSDYARLLRRKIEANGTKCYLLNTGWTGGAYGVGKRMKLADTRAMLKAILDGGIEQTEMRKDVNFGFAIPAMLDGVKAEVLDPRKGWNDGAAYDVAAAELVARFEKAKNKL
jgi:phosphoenolpyruvate carboxykinase (ATP)